jgi:hypothetical protein
MATLTRRHTWKKWAPDIGENRELEGGPVLFLELATGLTAEQLTTTGEKLRELRASIKYATPELSEEATQEERLAAIKAAITIPAKLTADPIDRSIPPDTINNVVPIARMPMMELWTRTFWRFPHVKKTLDRDAVTTPRIKITKIRAVLERCVRRNPPNFRQAAFGVGVST